MSSAKVRRLRYRPLLTETLPYELPVIFSNDRFFASLVADEDGEAVRLVREKINKLCETATRPYCFSISKDGSGRTELGVVHPLSQLRISEFYEQYAQTLLECCGRSEFSLRKPTRIARAHWLGPLDTHATEKLGIPHVDSEKGEIDVSRIVSYFAYAKYNLLFKFFESEEFVRLEKRFSCMRTLDVSKCFFNIYTHSLTWAVKGRELAKLFRNAYSFERQFDKLMQNVNDSETNGIVVGPEVSRLFAEVIFQDIDSNVQLALSRLNKSELVHERDYAVRRYIDDFFVFARTEQELDKIEQVVRAELGKYKLFANESKIATFQRPFVSSISLARHEIKSALSEIMRFINAFREVKDNKSINQLTEKFYRTVWNIRLIVAKYQVGFHTISGWLMSSLKAALRDVAAAIGAENERAVRAALVESVLRLIQLVFYVCALDMRVRTSYSLCQIAATLKKFIKRCSEDEADRINQVFLEELVSLCQGVAEGSSAAGDEEESIELYNLLICGAFFAGEEFVRQRDIWRILESIEARPLRYFGFITLKFCYFKCNPIDGRVRKLNDQAAAIILAHSEDVKRDAEMFLFFSEYLAASDVPVSAKRKVLKVLGGGDPSNAAISALSGHLGFADMDGMRIEHTLQRKELRPAYAW